MSAKNFFTTTIIWLVPVYLLAFTISAIWLLFDGWLNQFSSLICIWSKTPEQTVPELIFYLLFTIIGSLLGSALLGITSFHRYKAVEKSFEMEHVWGYFFLPLLAIIVGILAFALVQAGLFVLAGDVSGKNSPESASLGYIAIGGVTGYNWDIFIKKMQELSANVMNTKSNT
ncbi:hypothetical protein ACN2AK_22020 [Shewanella xiamenensis]|uniref:hypothetical protein n=1 Tax=Providencia stuartii TaxID=588 RepID=UPI00146E17F3|nr:hypothetical protein [Providencia stuartii]NMT48844.1 hypothetical protein [Providencia stuartii]